MASHGQALVVTTNGPAV